MSVFLITGCNRGLGLGLTKEVLRAGHSVIGTCRNPNGERDLWELEDDYPEKLKVIEMDLSSEQSIKEGFGSLPSDQHIDILINNAGILEDFNSGIESLDFDVLLRSFKINTVGSLLVVKHALPFLKKALDPKMFHMSSELGSIEGNLSGRGYAYRTSKSALNMVSKNLALEFPKITSVVLHPGWVKTRMGGERAPMTIDDSVSQLFSLILSLGLKDTGRFINYKGEELPW